MSQITNGGVCKFISDNNNNNKICGTDGHIHNNPNENIFNKTWSKIGIIMSAEATYKNLEYDIYFS